MACYLTSAVSFFFLYYTVMSGEERILLSQFLSWVMLWCGIYFAAYFSPCPHPRENVSDIESYFSKRLPYFYKLGGLGLIILPIFLFEFSDPSVLDSGAIRMVGLGLFSIFIGFILSVAIDKYGIRIVKAIFTFFAFTCLIVLFTFDLTPRMTVLE